MKVGFIGLGTMGASMASNLQRAGYELVVNDIREEAASPHLAAGAEWADSPREIAERTDVVFTSLPTPPDVDLVALGENGLLEGMAEGTAYQPQIIPGNGKLPKKLPDSLCFFT